MPHHPPHLIENWSWRRMTALTFHLSDRTCVFVTEGVRHDGKFATPVPVTQEMCSNSLPFYNFFFLLVFILRHYRKHSYMYHHICFFPSHTYIICLTAFWIRFRLVHQSEQNCVGVRCAFPELKLR